MGSNASPARRITSPGLIFLGMGLGLILYEMQTQLLQDRMGAFAHNLIIFCGIAFSIWGLKEIIADFYPRITTRTARPTFEGLVYLGIMCVLFIGSQLGRSNPLLMVFAAMAGPFVMNGWFTYSMLQRLRVRRDLPERIMAGEPFAGTIVLENKKLWLSLWMMSVSDRVRRESGRLTPQVSFLRVPARSARRGDYRLQLFERGRYDFGPLQVTTRFPLGLVERGLTLDARQQLLVYPRLGRLNPAWRKQLRHSMELVSHLRPSQGTFQDEIHRIREYRPGDDSRLIHWRTSARMNELMVCEYQESRDRDLLLIVDAWLPEPHQAENSEHVERALRFAATLCLDYLQDSRQSSLTVHILGRKPVVWHGESGERHVESLLDALALLEPASGGDLAEIRRVLDQDHSGRQRILIVSPRAPAIRREAPRMLNGTGADVQIYGASEEELHGIWSEN